VALVWWCAASVLTAVSGVLFRRMVAILSAANPAARLPWFGRPANTSRSARAPGFVGALSVGFTMECVIFALRQRHLYDIFLGLSLMLIPLVMQVDAHARHNRRVRRAAEPSRAL
jgi:hypothetical protein